MPVLLVGSVLWLSHLIRIFVLVELSVRVLVRVVPRGLVRDGVEPIRVPTAVRVLCPRTHSCGGRNGRRLGVHWVNASK